MEFRSFLPATLSLPQGSKQIHAFNGVEIVLSKLFATDGKSFQYAAGSMTGMTQEEYAEMMLKGGRPIEGNRYVGEKR